MWRESRGPPPTLHRGLGIWGHEAIGPASREKDSLPPSELTACLSQDSLGHLLGRAVEEYFAVVRIGKVRETLQ